ncbi:unnamed protein product [Cercopithifilaria johnstoni]|uniref:Uncharacterized protein n=1 Tax=Cercopithifilaria johnstoni TaxID=2874296 RepID=A0A8J2M9F7_9BILA|nr:unnamed protein product [Cercopithifilaria johnstoni]
MSILFAEFVDKYRSVYFFFLTERGEQQRTVTVFIKEAAATSRAFELLQKYTEQESWEARLPSKYTKYGDNNASNDYKTKSFLRVNLTSDESSKITVEQELTHAVANGDTMNTNDICTLGDISRATQTVNKSSGIVISFNELNSVSSIENGCANTNKIASIDEDERAGNRCRSSNMYIGEDKNGHMNGSGFKNVYTQGNSVQEIRALNDSDDDEVMVNIMSKVSKEIESVSITEANITENGIQKGTEASAAINAQGKHDDNPFTYSAGQLRLHGNRVGTYDMQKSRTIGVKRDLLAADGECDFTYKEYVSPTFLSLIPADTSNSILARELIPAHFDGRETYAKGLLDPTEDTRLDVHMHHFGALVFAAIKMLCKHHSWVVYSCTSIQWQTVFRHFIS